MSKVNKIFELIGASAVSVILVAALIPALVLYSSFVLYKLWVWFAVPAGLPALSYWHVYGICLLLNFATRHNSRCPKEEQEYRSLTDALVAPALTLLFGYIVKSFLM